MKFRNGIIALLIGSTAFAASTQIWTDWYKHGLLEGGLQLVNMREWLQDNALSDTYVTQPDTLSCDPAKQFVRTADGSCNSLDDPAMGSAWMRFGRNMSADKLAVLHVPSDAEIFSPNPREISRELLTRTAFKPVPFLNMFAATWIQFMVHDWLSHGENEANHPFLLPLAPGDPFGSEMMILRTQIDSSRTSADSSIPMSFRNENTHWWDGSQIYGSDQNTQNKVRSFKDGKMLVDAKGNIPIDSADDVELAGFKRNWWLGLDLMHQLFVREHNAIASRLKASYPNWDDQTLFDHARLVNVAVMAKIHTVEWTPAILKNPILKAGMEANWYGYNSHGGTTWDPLKPVQDPVLNGIVAGKNDLHGVPYSITEEFTSVYRLHSLLPEALDIRANSDSHPIRSVPLETTRDDQAHQVLSQFDMTDLMYSLGTQHPGALTLNNYPKFMQNLSIPLVGKYDMGTIDIVRDRERGVLRYNAFRAAIGLTPINTFEDLTSDPVVLEKLHRLYGTVDQLDLLIGTLAETQRPDGFGFGETQFQIFLLMASRRLEADRFFTTDYRAEVYTQEGLDWVDQSSFKKVLLRHFPGLGKHLEGIEEENAFRPWN
jgi:hypothetical protein